MTYPAAFLLNLGAECVVVLCVLGFRQWPRLLLGELALNLATHPLLWLGYSWWSGAYWRGLLAAELLVVLVEIALALAVWRGRFRPQRIAAAVLLANLATFSLTFLV